MDILNVKFLPPVFLGAPRALLSESVFARVAPRGRAAHPDFVVTPVGAGWSRRGLEAPVFYPPTSWAWEPRPGGALDQPRGRYGGACGFASYGEALTHALNTLDGARRGASDEYEHRRRAWRASRTAANRANRVLRAAGCAVRAVVSAYGAEVRGLAGVPHDETARAALVAAGWSYWHTDDEDAVGYWGPAQPPVGRRAARRVSRPGCAPVGRPRA